MGVQPHVGMHSLRLWILIHFSSEKSREFPENCRANLGACNFESSLKNKDFIRLHSTATHMAHHHMTQLRRVRRWRFARLSASIHSMRRSFIVAFPPLRSVRTHGASPSVKGGDTSWASTPPYVSHHGSRSRIAKLWSLQHTRKMSIDFAKSYSRGWARMRKRRKISPKAHSAYQPKNVSFGTTHACSTHTLAHSRAPHRVLTSMRELLIQ